MQISKDKFHIYGFEKPYASQSERLFRVEKKLTGLSVDGILVLTIYLMGMGEDTVFVICADQILGRTYMLQFEASAHVRTRSLQSSLR